MTPFVAISVTISVILILIMIGWRDNDDVWIPCIVMLLLQGFFGYLFLGSLLPCGGTIRKEFPVSEYQIVKGQDRVYLIQDGKTLKEFTDAKTVLISDYKAIIKIETLNGYNFVLDERTTYELK